MNTLRPMLSALRRQKTATLLIMLEIAVAAAILCNALYLVSQRVLRMQAVSGIDEHHLVHISASGRDPDTPADIAQAEDLSALRALPGVESAISVATFPFLENSWNISLSLTLAQPEPDVLASMLIADENFLATSGMQLQQGRWFQADEVQTFNLFNSTEDAAIPSVVITRALADKLFPGQNALGKTLYGLNRKHGSRIIGISENMLAPGRLPTNEQTQYLLAFFPIRPTNSSYVLHIAEGASAQVMRDAEAALVKVDGNRIIETARTFKTLRQEYYSRDRAVVWLLVVVCALMLAITLFGIGGLASFWVQQRTRQIGIRRALGATRGDILRYFQSENFLIVSAGIVVGLLLAFGLNQFLMSKYELPRLPWQTLPIAAVVLWLLGQLAVLAPALRAAAIPPAIATRSV